jgi:hypothetical protein
MLYIFFTIGKLNCPVVDLGSWKDWALVQDRSQVTKRQSVRLCGARGVFVWLGFSNPDPLLGSTRLVGSSVTVLPKCSTGLKCVRN